MKYKHQFEIRAPLADVAEFHRRSSSMGAITPPPVIAQVHQAPEILSDGSDMIFTLWLGPLPIRWHACIEQVNPNGFVDRQIRGPFAKWIHTHTFQKVDAERTIVHDEIEAELSPHWIWKAVGLGMWLNMPILFAFRGWKTRRILE